MTNATRHAYIQHLLDLFFAGETTCTQERELEQYFREATSLPKQWLPYREMFGWYEHGMVEAELPDDVPLSPHRPATEGSSGSQPRQRLWIWVGSAAASLALIVTLALRFSSQPTASPDLYAGSLVVHNGVAVSGSEEIAPEVEATLLLGADLNAEINAEIAAAIHAKI